MTKQQSGEQSQISRTRARSCDSGKDHSNVLHQTWVEIQCSKFSSLNCFGAHVHVYAIAREVYMYLSRNIAIAREVLCINNLTILLVLTINFVHQTIFNREVHGDWA